MNGRRNQYQHQRRATLRRQTVAVLEAPTTGLASYWHKFLFEQFIATALGISELAMQPQSVVSQQRSRSQLPRAVDNAKQAME